MWSNVSGSPFLGFTTHLNAIDIAISVTIAVSAKQFEKKLLFMCFACVQYYVSHCTRSNSFTNKNCEKNLLKFKLVLRFRC
jgi:hypothetical protein